MFNREEIIAFAAKNNIYINEAENVLNGTMTLEEAKNYTKQFNEAVESGEIKLVHTQDVNNALNECLNHLTK